MPRSDRRARNVDELTVEAAAAANLDAETFSVESRAMKRLLMLFAMAAEAAARTTVEGKIRALGRAVARGTLAADDAIVDEQQFIVSTLADLEAVHLRILVLLAESPAPDADGVHTISSGQRVAAAYGDLARPVLAVLSRHGLVEQVRSYDRPGAESLNVDALFDAYRVTGYARKVLEHLAVGTE